MTRAEIEGEIKRLQKKNIAVRARETALKNVRGIVTEQMDAEITAHKRNMDAAVACLREALGSAPCDSLYADMAQVGAARGWSDRDNLSQAYHGIARALMEGDNDLRENNNEISRLRGMTPDDEMLPAGQAQ